MTIRYGHPKPLKTDLTAREVQVLQLTAEGLESTDTAKELGIAAGTVRKLRCMIFIKIGADNAAHAVAIAMRRGLIQ